MNGLCQQITRVEGVVLFLHGPGDHQHLGSDLDACFGLDASLLLTAFQYPVVYPANRQKVAQGKHIGLWIFIEQALALANKIGHIGAVLGIVFIPTAVEQFVILYGLAGHKNGQLTFSDQPVDQRLVVLEYIC